MSRYKATLAGDGIATDNSDLDADNEAQQVFLWDIGPEKPVQPVRPIAPKGREGSPEYELALLEFRDELERYSNSLHGFRQAIAEYEDWVSRNGGPVEIQRWSVDANDALRRDPKRYFISSRTRGYTRAPNLGLPEGLSPGRLHADNVRRRREADEEFVQIRRSDPVFGHEVAAA
jgi:hypothetical protein